ncbi:MAG: hypothetical protein R3F65_16260 [bacterium]
MGFDFAAEGGGVFGVVAAVDAEDVHAMGAGGADQRGADAR